MGTSFTPSSLDTWGQAQQVIGKFWLPPLLFCLSQGQGWDLLHDWGGLHGDGDWSWLCLQMDSDKLFPEVGVCVDVSGFFASYPKN